MNQRRANRLCLLHRRGFPYYNAEYLLSDAAEDLSLRRQLAEARENLRLIEEQKAKYVRQDDAPLQLIKEERRLRRRIAELARRLGMP